jgi:two-component system chemotaxis response regulator CheB
MNYQECFARKIRPIVVIGASAGGIEALTGFLSRIDESLSAIFFITLHLGADGASQLVEVLGRASRIPVRFAEDKAPILINSVYLAPPDYHLMIEEERMRLSHGPQENLSRPAIDPLFRSAAVAYRDCVVGVVLTGMLTDGTSGLYAVKKCGGVTIVQDPRDAIYPSMPESALTYVKSTDGQTCKEREIFGPTTGTGGARLQTGENH